MARGRPSSLRQISAQASGSSSTLNPGRAAAPRSASSRSATGVGSGSTGRSNSPGTPRGSRLVARTVRPGQCSSRVSTRRAAASTTCSQLSRISSIRRLPQCSASRSTGSSCRSPPAALIASAPAPYITVSRAPTAVSTASGTASGSSTGASSASHTPSRAASRIPSAASCDSRVFPAPPGPRRVTRRAAARSFRMTPMSASRPTKEVRRARRLPGRGVAEARSTGVRVSGQGPLPSASPAGSGSSGLSNSPCSDRSSGPGSEPRRSASRCRTSS